MYIFSFLYLVFVAGNSSVLDKFFTLFMTGFTIIVLPAFYLNGDIEFRTDLAENGYFTALKNALFDLELRFARGLRNSFSSPSTNLENMVLTNMG